MNKIQELERAVFELVGDASSRNSVNTVKALEAACMILDHKFGNDFSKTHPEIAVQLTETIMKNARMNDFHSTVKNGIGEYLDALRIVILEKDCNVTGSLSVDIPGEVKIDR